MWYGFARTPGHVVGGDLQDVACDHYVRASRCRSATTGMWWGELAPGVRDLHAGLRATHNVLLSHGRTVEAFRASNAKGDIGIINAMADIRPASDDPADLAAAERTNAYYHALYLDPIVRGEYPEMLREWFADGWPSFPDEDLKLISTPMEFIGIDYYCGSIVAADPEGAGQGGVAEEIGAAGPIGAGLARMLHARVVAPEGPFTDIGWEITPEGLYNVLVWLRDRYPGMPVHITEIGAAFDDEVSDGRRLGYIRDHLVEARRAIDEGVDLRSCFIWSFTDTWEYNLGYGARFGLVHVDYETQRRTVKASGRWFSETALANGFTLDGAGP